METVPEKEITALEWEASKSGGCRQPHISDSDPEKSSLRGGGYRRWTVEDAERWVEQFHRKKPIVEIAKEEGVDPGTVSSWLHKLGIEIKQGEHHVAQPPLNYSEEFIDLVIQGPEKVLESVRTSTWGAMATQRGIQQLDNFSRFFQLHRNGVGVKEAARILGVHRSTIANWREGMDQPYLAKIVNSLLGVAPHEKGWTFLPLHVSAGANELTEWVPVPERLRTYEYITKILDHLKPCEETYERSRTYGLSLRDVDSLRTELLAYDFGMMLGDAGKLGGKQERFKSMNIDIQLTKSEPSNKVLGEFACMCFNTLGLSMHRIKDKPPSGSQLEGENPAFAYRWTSERSPILAWMFNVGLGLGWDQNTSNYPVRMEWIFEAPYQFRKRLMQAIADSDGTVKASEVIITSVPNAVLITRLLQSLGLTTAHTVYENGWALRTMVNRREAARLPIFNEFVRGYRYEKLLKNGGVKS